MPKRKPSPEEPLNLAKAAELRAHNLTPYWLVLSPVEVQALADGVLPSQIIVYANEAIKARVGDWPLVSEHTKRVGDALSSIHGEGSELK